MGLLSEKGRIPRSIDYSSVTYNNKEYNVAKIHYNNDYIYAVFDKEDYEEVKKFSWHVSGKNYIGTNVKIEDKIKELYLHNFVMNKMDFEGKGSKQTVDHINRNGYDNRKENLRIISQSQQNINQKKKERNITLPENCGISSDNIPKHIWYVKANGGHGDRFAIDLKTENIEWKGTSSKKISLKDKLDQAIQKLQELYIKYPYLNPEYEANLIKKLNDEYSIICSHL